MRTTLKLFAVVACLVLASSSAWAYYSSYDLNRAERMRERGDYYDARRLYRDISDSYGTDSYIRREATYWIGFCSVKLNEPHRAIDEYRRFLRNYDNGNTRYVPDTLYVLGRCYEWVNDTYRAKEYYRECVRRFRYGEFPDKSRERLRYLGDYNYNYDNGGYGPYYYSTKSGNLSSTMESTIRSKNDPFIGLQMDNGQVDRINKMIESAKTGNLESGLAELRAGEETLSIVAQEIKNHQTKEKFEALHTRP